MITSLFYHFTDQISCKIKCCKDVYFIEISAAQFVQKNSSKNQILRGICFEPQQKWIQISVLFLQKEIYATSISRSTPQDPHSRETIHLLCGKLQTCLQQLIWGDFFKLAVLMVNFSYICNTSNNNTFKIRRINVLDQL